MYNGKGSVLPAPPRTLAKEEYAKEVDKSLRKKWQHLYDKRRSDWSRKMVPKGTAKPAMEVNIFTGQALTGHGCFRAYRHKIGKLPSAECASCEQMDETAEHALVECPRFKTGRLKELNLENMETCRYIKRIVKDLWIAENGPKSIREPLRK